MKGMGALPCAQQGACELAPTWIAMLVDACVSRCKVPRPMDVVVMFQYYRETPQESTIKGSPHQQQLGAISALAAGPSADQVQQQHRGQNNESTHLTKRQGAAEQCTATLPTTTRPAAAGCRPVQPLGGVQVLSIDCAFTCGIPPGWQTSLPQRQLQMQPTCSCSC
jgi:hypothetical protein